VATVIEPGVIGNAAIKRVAYLTGMNEYEAFGRLSYLWEASQALGQTTGTVDEVGFWLGASTPEESSKWVAAFSDRLAKFLIQRDDGTFEIRGNAKHISKVSKTKELARARAERRWQKEYENASCSNAPAVPPASNSDAGRMPRLDQARPGQARLDQAGQGILPETLSALKQTWLETLKAMGSERERLTASEELLIAQAITLHRQPIEDVDLALYGARHEPGFEGFNPKVRKDLARILTPDKEGRPRIQKFVEYGASGRARERAENEKREKRDKVLDDEGVPPPEEIRQKLAAFGLGRMPR
jgi:hypothetical protein